VGRWLGENLLSSKIKASSEAFVILTFKNSLPPLTFTQKSTTTKPMLATTHYARLKE
jgi:hypothetical protein